MQISRRLKRGARLKMRNSQKYLKVIKRVKYYTIMLLIKTKN